ncbi:MAG: 1-acyl-sn-glycerol-3-phosphate acyltransferase [Alphaproteobacteria bacterium]
MSKLRTLVFFAGWFAFTGAVGFLALPALLSRRATWHVARFWARGTLLWLARSTGMHSRVEGSEHLKGARIVACKHQSAWDTLMLWVILGHPVFILKARALPHPGLRLVSPAQRADRHRPREEERHHQAHRRGGGGASRAGPHAGHFPRRHAPAAGRAQAVPPPASAISAPS